MNKRGQIAELVQDTAGLIFIIVIFALFFVLSLTFGFPKKEIKVLETERKVFLENHYSLYSFLNKRVQIENKNMTIADLIRLSKLNSTYEKIVREKIGNFNEYCMVLPEKIREVVDKKDAYFFIPSTKDKIIIECFRKKEEWMAIGLGR